MASQLGHIGRSSVPSAPSGGIQGLSDRPTLTQLVMAAAGAAREKLALSGSDYSITFGDLRSRAQGAATAMSRGPGVDDSALTIALMTAVPGLALAGPSGLSDALSSIRIQAMLVLAESGPV